MTSDLDATLETLAPVGLGELDDRLSLQTRTDRKYVLNEDDAVQLLDSLGDVARVLDLSGRRRSSYESVYFDTPGFDSFRGAALRRPCRFKVRTRRYVEQDLCWIEIKRRNRRGQNDKVKRWHDPSRPAALTAASYDFLESDGGITPHVGALRPVVRTSYRRSTLAVDDQRLTIDSDLFAEDLLGLGAGVGIGRRLIVETKSWGRPGVADRALWRLGHRPVTFSKFAVGMASFHPSLPRNKWHRALDRWVVPDHVHCADAMVRRPVSGVL